MYPSGQWEGFWFQEAYGQQRMNAFTLRFHKGEIAGEGRDVVGRFTFTGSYDARNGEVVMIKQYLGKHRVFYRGQPDGEGCIAGVWSIGESWTGPFMMKPALGRPRGDEPIEEMD
ncbi:MAG TPA: hypothetical protein VGL71_03830 [Urbifossiella sp.]